MKSPFQPRTRILEEKRKTDTPAAVKPTALSDDLWVVRFWQQGQMDHLRLSSALAQICLDVQHALQLSRPTVGEHLYTLSRSLVSSLCQSEMSEMKV